MVFESLKRRLEKLQRTPDKLEHTVLSSVHSQLGDSLRSKYVAEGASVEFVGAGHLWYEEFLQKTPSFLVFQVALEDQGKKKDTVVMPVVLADLSLPFLHCPNNISEL